MSGDEDVRQSRAAAVGCALVAVVAWGMALTVLLRNERAAGAIQDGIGPAAPAATVVLISVALALLVIAFVGVRAGSGPSGRSVLGPRGDRHAGSGPAGRRPDHRRDRRRGHGDQRLGLRRPGLRRAGAGATRPIATARGRHPVARSGPRVANSSRTWVNRAGSASRSAPAQASAVVIWIIASWARGWMTASAIARECVGVPASMTCMYGWMAGRARETLPMSDEPVPPRRTGCSTVTPWRRRWWATRSAMVWLFFRSR